MHRKTISGIPGWLLAGVADYQTKHNIQSWSQALLELAIRGIVHVGEQDVDSGGYFGGSESNENELWDGYYAAQESGFDGKFEDWLIAELKKNTWGGEREKSTL